MCIYLNCFTTTNCPGRNPLSLSAEMLLFTIFIVCFVLRPQLIPHWIVLPVSFETRSCLRGRGRFNCVFFFFVVALVRHCCGNGHCRFLDTITIATFKLCNIHCCLFRYLFLCLFCTMIFIKKVVSIEQGTCSNRHAKR